MRSKVVILCVTVVLLLLGLNGPANSQPPKLASMVEYDTTDIAIEYTTAYPGTETWITVWMRNPEWVSGFRFNFEIMGFADVSRFCCDDTGGCFIDTTGCLANTFSWLSCSCGMGVIIQGSAEGDTLKMIPPRDTAAPLFRIRMDVCCIPDADTGRSAYIYIHPVFSALFGRNGDLLPFDYYPMGELFVWWSVPGDANGDSLTNISDIVFLINYLYQEGPEPCVCEAADCNNDNTINAADIVHLINYLFFEGPQPARGSVSCWYEDCWP